MAIIIYKSKDNSKLIMRIGGLFFLREIEYDVKNDLEYINLKKRLEKQYRIYNIIYYGVITLIMILLLKSGGC